MKKVLILLSALVLGFVAVSCDRNTLEPGQTAAMELAGEWYVTCDLIDASGNVIFTGADAFGLEERFLLLTYNTAKDVATEIFIDDLEEFWPVKVQCTGDPSALTFGVTDGANLYEDEAVTVTGKIVKNGTKTPSGQPADYIEVLFTFQGDTLPSAYGFNYYRLSGWRNTGFVLDM